MPHTIAIIQARFGSTRLPGKVLERLVGVSVLETLVERVRPAGVDEWWLATTRAAEDDATAAAGAMLGLRVHRGETEDVLSRYVAIAAARRPELVVRLTADDPFTDAAVIDLLLADARAWEPGVAHEGEDLDRRALPLGYAPEVVRADALAETSARIGAGQSFHRAHVTSWLRATGRSRSFQPPRGWPRRPAWRWTVDTPADLAAAREAFEAFGPTWRTIGYRAMVRVLDARSEIMERNAAVPQKALQEG